MVQCFEGLASTPQNSSFFEDYEILYLSGSNKAVVGTCDKIGRLEDSSKCWNINTDIFFGS